MSNLTFAPMLGAPQARIYDGKPLAVATHRHRNAAARRRVKQARRRVENATLRGLVGPITTTTYTYGE